MSCSGWPVLDSKDSVALSLDAHSVEEFGWHIGMDHASHNEARMGFEEHSLRARHEIGLSLWLEFLGLNEFESFNES